MSKKKSSLIPLHLTERALSDLVAIEAYSIKQWGKRVAAKYLSDIEGRLLLVQENPVVQENSGLLSSAEGLPEVLQCYPGGKHILIFDVMPDSLVLLTVIHGNIDLPNQLAELVLALATEIQLLHGKLPSREK